MKLEQVAGLLEDAGLGTQGKDIFINRLPVTVSIGILLKTTTTGTPIDYELLGYFKGKFQLIIRHSDYAAGMALAEQASAALTVEEVQLDDMYVKYMRPKHLPVAFPVNDADLIEISVNFDACYIL